MLGGMRLWLCVLTPEALAYPFQLSGWKQASAHSVARRTLNLRLSSLPTRRKAIDFNENWTSSTTPGQLENTSRNHSGTLPFTISASVCAPACARLLCWGSQCLWRNNSKTQPSASAVKLMRQRWPWGSWLQSELAMLTDQDKPQSLVIWSRVTAN